MKSTIKLLICMALVLTPWLVQAKIFICKDASGRTLTSDRPIPECADRASRELGSNGLTKREIAAPLTAEQKQKMKLAEEKKKEEELAAAEQARQDLAIKSRYNNEADIERARHRQADPLIEKVKKGKEALSISETKLKEWKAENTPKSGKELSINQRQTLDGKMQAIEFEKKIIAESEADLLQINTKFDATLKRFREIAAQAAAK